MLFGFINKLYRNNVYKRNGYSDTVYYFSASDFDGLREEKHPIKSSLGHTLAGRFYSYGTASYDRIIIFEHGMGAGHRSYMKEIELLCRRGYTVFAYDHTGCAESGGDETGGFLGSLIDLNDVLSALKSDGRFASAVFSVVGHSWGGFSALNISAFHKDISHIVAISGFVSIERIIEQYMGKIPFGMSKRIYADECLKNPTFAKCSAEHSLRETAAKVLIIHSRDDKTVSAKDNFDYLKQTLSDREGTYFIELDGRDHNPNYTPRAIEYKANFFTELKRSARKLRRATPQQKKDFVSTYDFNVMTEQDTELWDRICEFLES